MGSDRVVLNVGGTRFHTTVDTLSNGESCMLSNLVSGNWKECGTGSDEEIFIDRDGTYFRYILNYFRSGGLVSRSPLNRIADMIVIHRAADRVTRRQPGNRGTIMRS